MQPADSSRHRLSDQAFRNALRAIVTRSGRSMRSLSLAMGRDPGYVAALLDPSRPSRARPTPDDLLALSDATSIPLIELLAALWAIPPERLASELDRSVPGDRADERPGRLSASDRRLLVEFEAFLASRPRRPSVGSKGDR
jgi:hypothetical protein